MIIHLYPVIAVVPDKVSRQKGRQRVESLSRLARQCATQSAEHSGWRLNRFIKNDAGAPLSDQGVFWSVSHKPEVVAGVASLSHIGIDVEQIRPISQRVFDRILAKEETVLFDRTDRVLDFFRAFTAKEAVLKHNGKGLGSLSIVRIDSVLDDRNLCVRFLKHKYWVENFIHGSYLASVTRNECKVVWNVTSA